MEGSYSRNGRGWISISDEHCPTLFSVHCLYRFPREGSTLLVYNEPPEKQQWKHLHQNIIFYYWSYFCVMCMNITGGIHNSTCCSSRQHIAGVGCTCDQSLFSCWRLLCYHSACLHGQLTTHSWKLLTNYRSGNAKLLSCFCSYKSPFFLELETGCTNSENASRKMRPVHKTTKCRH